MSGFVMMLWRRTGGVGLFWPLLALFGPGFGRAARRHRRSNRDARAEEGMADGRGWMLREPIRDAEESVPTGVENGDAEDCVLTSTGESAWEVCMGW